MNQLSDITAYITINPYGPYLWSVQQGFAKQGIFPKYLIQVSALNRLKKEWQKHRLSIIKKLVVPKFKAIVRKTRNSSTVRESIPKELRPKVFKVPSLNSNETLEITKHLGIRYLINAGAGIFGPGLLADRDLIVINGHAGILPKYRNMNALEWTIYNGDPIMGTVHRIDAGIDTGPILLQEPLDTSNAQTLREAREIAFDQVGRMIARAVIRLDKGEIREVQQSLRGGLKWYTMHPVLQEETEKRLRAKFLPS